MESTNGGQELGSESLIVEKSIADISELEQKVASSLHIELGTQEAVRATDQALVYVAETTVGSAYTTDAEKHDAVDDLAVESALELDAGIGANETPLQQFESDGYQDSINDVVSRLHLGHATLPSGHEAAPIMMKALDELTIGALPSVVEYIHPESHPREKSKGALRSELSTDPAVRSEVQALIPNTDKLRSLVIVEASNSSLVANAINERAEGDKNPKKAWQERTFGNVDQEKLESDVLLHFERPTSERLGEVILVDGVEKRPIMNIELGAQAKAEVQATIAERTSGLDSVLKKLQLMQETSQTMSYEEYRSLLYDAKLQGRQHGNLLDGSNPGATVADLYIDENDLVKYDSIDKLGNEVAGYNGPDSRKILAESILQLAANSFPSGVELMHSIKKDTLTGLIEHGNLAPRSQRKHGQETQNSSLNGAFIHMTGPGSMATEYGDAVVAGISIDTIVKHSPYMQLEDNYTNNSFTRKNGDTYTQSSTQYRMDKITIKELATAPDAFRLALLTMHKNIQDGLQPVNIGQGDYNNYSFAAGDTAETAGAYQYPLKEVSIYATAEARLPILVDTANSPNADVVASVTTLVSESPQNAVEHNFKLNRNAVLLNAVELPSFDYGLNIQQSIYIPVSSREVPFTETQAGNSKSERSIPHTLETIKTESVPQYLDGLITDGLAPKEALQEAMKSVNNNRGTPIDLIKSYIGGIETFVNAGISATEIVEGLSDNVVKNPQLIDQIGFLREEAPPELSQYDAGTARELGRWVNRGEYASHEIKQNLIKLLADRLYAANPDAFVMRAPALQKFGYEFSGNQQSAISAHEAEQTAKDSGSFEIPDGPVF
jgi:hypothetical protein